MINWLRADLSNKLIWWIKPGRGETPLGDLLHLLQRGRLHGEQPAYIYGKRRCIAFSETPLIQAARLLLNARQAGINFAPYGLLFDRNALYRQGARQTIHQPLDELALLHQDHYFRHVTLSPDEGVDFTWKREWRLPVDELPFSADTCTLILPDGDALQWLRTHMVSPLTDNALLLEHLL
ncbi:hypothetical protein [Erwinia piriflorinigrans]|uniref:Uncharacterized protein n=1 Tax=Erwinia piriflorinigrans CFBP 5888 TaxID=1161919 RepID=V5ZDI7_9GAMM|nr:hypothetical protein [Erwinia piriflorinigrans]CCG89146.1 hypothetical protein EPIR_3783 [Erwinia piriflorinigrans CFBP 5888]